VASLFRRELAARATDPANRRWVYAAYDQLTDAVGPLARLDPKDAGLVLVESPAKAARRPYHRQKLALVLANGRRFALEQAERGVAVRHVVARDSLADALREAVREIGPMAAMEPAERELRVELAPLARAGELALEPHGGWLTTHAEFLASQGGEAPFRMDAFYRAVRRRTGWLMERGKPIGGRFSFDGENREPWRGEPAAPPSLEFEPDGLVHEVCELVATRYASHPGELNPRDLPTSAADARALWRHFLEHGLAHFGPYEDAMARESLALFHAKVAGLVNLCRLLPGELCEDVLASSASLASVEGFVRQVLGWREFVRHVHLATDGFRDLAPQFGGDDRGRAPLVNGHAAPNHLAADLPLPPAYWGGVYGGSASGLACLDHEVASVWRTGYGHHITRLMVLANVATLLGVRPRELTDWFWCAYTDAYDWVVEPNVLGMGTFAVGELMTTKPYVSGAPYVARQSDHCGACAFDPKKDCPLTPLYWDFLARNAHELAGNQRIALPLRSLAKRTQAQRARDAALADLVRRRLASGARVAPGDLDAADRRAR
jgi:deoxyribodipyrimidine photolyase-related protein